MNGLLIKKPLRSLMVEADSDQGLKRALGPVNLTLLGIGAIIGAGIFVLTGQAAAMYAGPGIVLSFVISGIGCTFAGLCYAEMASMIPIAGSAYTYSYATMGEFFAWLIGWDLILEYSLAATTVSIGWSGYVVSFLKDLGIIVPQVLSEAPWKLESFNINLSFFEPAFQAGASVGGATAAPVALLLTSTGTTNPTTVQQWIQTGAWFNLPAVLIIAIITTLLVVGIRESARVNAGIVVVKLFVVLVFIACGIAFLNPENWRPFIPENKGEFGTYGWSGILRGAGVIFFAYIGFDAVSTAAQETRNPRRDLPIGILGSLSVCTVLYILVALALTGIVSYTVLNVPDPIAVGVDAIRWPESLSGLAGAVKALVKIGAIAGLSSVILVMLLGQPRIFWSMSKDGLLPPIVSKIHRRFGTPYITTIITGIAVAVGAALLPIGIAGELVSIGTLLAFVLVCAGVMTLRCTSPTTNRPFRCGILHVPREMLERAGRADILYPVSLTAGFIAASEGGIAMLLLSREGIIAGDIIFLSIALLLLAAALAGSLIDRYIHSRLKRVFRDSVLTSFVCMHGILVCIAQMASLPRDTWLRLIVWLVIGFSIYFTYGMTHSLLRSREANEDLIAKEEEE
jgi:APA family basic amino acid/polyamine antiporter